MRNCLHCILPPHILQSIAERGNERQRARALDALADSEGVRERRGILGRVSRIFPSGGDTKQRTIYDGREHGRLPGRVVRHEGEDPTGDPSVDEAYDGAGETYDLFKEEYNRDSINDNGLRLDSTVHYKQDYNNAFWNGTQMAYGDGDGELFNRFTTSVDIMGHELTHGVTESSAGLIYRGQSGALNESWSDVFGSLVKQRSKKTEAKRADWLIGEGLLTKDVKGKALRSMKEPGTAYDDPVLGKDMQPGHMDNYLVILQDKGGVHINSGIPNHAFYLLAVELGGKAWEKAGLIWYKALLMMQPDTDFVGAAHTTKLVARMVFGAGSIEEKAVIDSWGKVGIYVR
jgi:Zn-dependent metalloprotease